MTEEREYTVQEAAELTGAHEETIRRAIRRGELPNRRGWRQYYIKATDLEAWRLEYGDRLHKREEGGG